ncbi:MAG: V4R domain-containing protein [Methanospirillum sp.]
MTESEGADRTPTEVGFFRTPLGLRVVDSPTRGRILGLLGNGELAFEEIVERTGRAKSTVSVHLRELVADGVLGSRNDPDDGRRKYFHIEAEYLGRLSDADRLEADVGRLLSDYDPADPDPAAFYRAMLRSIRVALLGGGINIDPLLNAAGRGLGRGLALTFADLATGELLEALTGFWLRHSLGRLEVAATAPLELVVYDCFECMDLPYLGRPACAFERGLLTAVFDAHYGGATLIEETACYAMGSGHCRFVIEPADAA